MLDAAREFNGPITVGKAKLLERGKSPKKPVPYAPRLLRAIRILILKRNGGPGDGSMYIPVVLQLAVQIERERSHRKGWTGWARKTAQECMPYLDWSDDAQWDRLFHYYSRRRGMTHDQLAEQLKITEAELDECFETKRERCGLVSMQRPKKMRNKERAAAKAARRKAKRRVMGMAPREESASRTKPWIALGMSRRTWYRRGKPGGTGADGTSMTPNQPLGKGKGAIPVPAVPSIGIADEPEEKGKGSVEAWQAQLASWRPRHHCIERPGSAASSRLDIWLSKHRRIAAMGGRKWARRSR